MGKYFDRLVLCLAVLGIGFLYFRLTVRTMWLSIVLAVVLAALASYALAKKWPINKAARPKLHMRSLISRKRAPSCALYGALYMIIYLLTGQIIYLPLSLILLFLGGMGMREPITDCQDQS